MSDIESIYGRESVLSKLKKVNEPIDVKAHSPRKWILLNAPKTNTSNVNTSNFQ